MKRNKVDIVNPLPSADELHYWFEYRDGVLYWKERPGLRVNQGDIAGHIKRFATGCSHYSITLMGVQYRRSRLIYKMFFPDFNDSFFIEHINHNALDDKIENLMSVDILESNRNKVKHKSNRTGCVGVCFHARDKVYMVNIGGKRRHIGSFKTLEEAIAARKKAEEEMGYHENHGKTTQELKG